MMDFAVVKVKELTMVNTSGMRRLSVILICKRVYLDQKMTSQTMHMPLERAWIMKYGCFMIVQSVYLKKHIY